MIQVNWKETATRIRDVEELARLALALKNAKITTPIMVYFEFIDNEQLSNFCLGLNRTINDITIEQQKNIISIQEERIREFDGALSDFRRHVDQLRNSLNSKEEQAKAETQPQTRSI